MGYELKGSTVHRTSLSTTNVTVTTNNLPKSVKPQVKASIVIFPSV